MKILNKIDVYFSKINFYIIATLGITLVTLVFYGVLRRYIFGIPLVWGYELSILLFMWVAFLSMAMGFQKNRHRYITFVVDKIKKDKSKKIVEIFVAGLITAIAAASTVAGFLVFLEMHGLPFRTLPLSHGWLFLPLPISFAAMTITSIKNLVAAISNYSLKSSTDGI